MTEQGTNTGAQRDLRVQSLVPKRRCWMVNRIRVGQQEERGIEDSGRAQRQAARAQRNVQQRQIQVQRQEAGDTRNVESQSNWSAHDRKARLS